MEITSFLAGIILPIMISSRNRFSWLIRIALSLFTSYLILKYQDSKFYLWGIDEYTDKNFKILLNSDYFIAGAKWFGLTLAIAYIFFPILIKHFLLKKFEKSISKIHHSLPPSGIRFAMKFVKHAFEKFYKLLIYINVENPKRKMRYDEEYMSYNEFSDTIIYSLCTIIHSLIIVSYIHYNVYIASFIITIIIFNIILIPLIPIYMCGKNEIKYMMVDLNNKYHK